MWTGAQAIQWHGNHIPKIFQFGYFIVIICLFILFRFYSLLSDSEIGSGVTGTGLTYFQISV